MVFTIRTNGKSELELILGGIMQSTSKLSYEHKPRGNEATKDKKCAEETEVYVIPYEHRDGQIYGLFDVDGRIVENKLAFFVDQKRIQIGGADIPLVETGFLQDLTNKTDESVAKNSPYKILGININGITRPLKVFNYSNNFVNGIVTATTPFYTHTGSEELIGEVKRWIQNPGGARIVSTGGSLSNQRVIIPDWNNPRSIVGYLNRFIIGQEEAKRVVAVAFSNYMTKFQRKDESLQKENLLLIGSSGVGKTFMISLLAKVASLPFAETKLSGKSSEGYKGENLSEVFEQIRAKSAEEAPYGIVFLDEIDKLARDEWGSGGGFGSRLQNELIAWLEEATITGDKSNEKDKRRPINTRNILFVTAGAFRGANGNGALEALVEDRIGDGKPKLGFGAETGKRVQGKLEYSTPEDLIKYGFMLELVGRLPAVAVFKELSKDDKLQILKRSEKSCLANYQRLLSLKGYGVQVGDDVLEYIVEQAPRETGARALFSVCSDLFSDIIYDPEQFADDKKKINITPEIAKKLIRGNPAQ
jgi:ATP-dependent Clp protease ATP-binding subunit ClpX